MYYTQVLLVYFTNTKTKKKSGNTLNKTSHF